MRNHLKYSILITLILALIIGSVNAQMIGTSLQANPYESIPTVQTINTAPPTVIRSAIASMYDGDAGTYSNVYFLGTTGTAGWLRFSAFGNYPMYGEFPITWVTLTIKYAHPLGMLDDTYRWEWSMDGSTWTALTADTSGKFDSAGAAQMREFRIDEPTDGIWDWIDIGNVMVRYISTRVGSSFDGAARPIRIYELWLSVYSTPAPTGTSMSLQAPAITAQDYAYMTIFVDVYCNDVTDLAGWEYSISFDPAIMFAFEYYNYYPWTDIAVPDMGYDYIHIDGTIPVADPLFLTGVTGSYKVSRVGFMIMDDGYGMPPAPNFSWLRFTISFMGDPNANKIPHSVNNGYYGTPPANAYVIDSSPIPRPDLFPYQSPISTEWVEEYPEPGNIWHLSSWEDNEANGVLDPSDQIDMTPIAPPGDVAWFHVDQIWECDADPNTYVFMVLTIKDEVPEFPMGLGIMMAIAPLIAIVYIYRQRKRAGDK